MIKSIFFSRFLTKEGPKVLYQVPDGSIVPSTTCSQLPIIDFESVSSFVIPRQRFCDRLVSISTNHYRILGHPVCIESPKYDRNEFIFNLSIVLEEDEDHSSYITVVRKLAVLFRNLEEQGEFLSRDLEERQAGRSRGKVYALCEIILEDLNNYCECMIPIDESNTINIKLFPRFPPPPPVKAWHVPLSTVRLESLMDENWDLTMQRIIPHVDGIKSVRQIAERADADLNLVKKCIEHLLYYGCLLMLDIFQFGAIYAPTAEISTLIEDKTMQQECASYISMLEPEITTSALISLYTSLHQGQTLKSWCIEHQESLYGIDIRRFITFGVIKGFLYRIHKYALKLTGVNGTDVTSSAAHGGPHTSREASSLSKKSSRRELAARMTTSAADRRPSKTGTESRRISHTGSMLVEEEDEGRVSRRSLEVEGGDHGHGLLSSSNEASHSQYPYQRHMRDAMAEGGVSDIGRFLDGMHCFDEICTELQITEKELMSRIKHRAYAAGVSGGAVDAGDGAAGGAGGDIQILHK